MKNCSKYQRGYFMPPEVTYDWVKKEYIDHPPIWCSVGSAGWKSGADRAYESGGKAGIFSDAGRYRF